MRPDLELSKLIKSMAREAGFDLAGIAQVEDFPELARFPEWIAKGRAGDMKYLEARAPTGELRRASLKTVFPWANSVAVCAINYNTAHPYSTETAQADHGWVSRYAWSREDYHDSVLRRLHEVEARLKTSCGPGLQTRAYVDTGPVVERVYARYAGIGWLGKNTCLINQQVGSWLFLGVIITSLELLPDLPAPDRCGSCTRCIDACPTGAFPAPYELDSTRCIAYLTIEKHGEIPEELRDGIGHHVFGCDICQEVCPWNRRAPVTTKPEFEPREGLFNPALAWLAELTEDAFREKFRRSPLKRARRSGLRRNAIIAIGNTGNPCFLPLLEAAARDEDPVVTDAARWARRRILERG
jgi:epoxyqueuosine reductase